MSDGTDDGDETDDGAETDDGEGTDEGEPDPDPEPEPLCDVSQFEALPPMWTVQAPPDAQYFYKDMALLDDGALALAIDAKGQVSSRLQRFDDDGELVWDVDVDVDSGSRMAWGGDDFVYLARQDGVVRHSLDDGQLLLPWAGTFNPALQVFAIEADGPLLMVGGGVEYGEDGYQQYDAWIAGFDDAGTQLLYDELGSSGDESVSAIEALSSGGYVAVIGDAGLQFRGYGGAELSFDLIGLGDHSRAMLVWDRPEGLLSVVSAGDDGWTLLVTQQGEELWRKRLQACGPSIPAALSSASVGEDRLWVSTMVETGALVPSALLAEIGFDGELLAVRRFELEGENPFVKFSRYRNGRLFGVYGTGYAETARYGIARFF